jgi:hypothetical protein
MFFSVRERATEVKRIRHATANLIKGLGNCISNFDSSITHNSHNNNPNVIEIVISFKMEKAKMYFV